MTEKSTKPKTEVKKSGDEKAPEKPKLKLIQGGKSMKGEYNKIGEKKEEKPDYFKIINDYTYSAVAKYSYLSGEHPDIEGAKIALEKMYESFGAVPKDKWEGARVGSLASPEGIRRAIESYYGEYERAKGKLTLDEIPKLYNMNSYLDKLGEEARKNFENAFKGTETLEKIMEKVEEAGKMAKGKSEDSKEYKEAEEIIRKYSKILNTITRFEKAKLNKIRINNLDDLVLQNSLKNDFAVAA